MLLKLVDLTIGLRVTEEEEEIGLDLTQHGERGYTSDESGVPSLPGQSSAPPAAYAAAVHAPAPKAT